MWIVAKVKNNSFNLFKKEFSKKFIGEKITFYYPKFVCSTFSNGKKIERQISLLENYIFCKSEKFEKFNIKNFQFIKGLNFFLDGHSCSQRNIDDFVKICKLHEDKKGFIDFQVPEKFEPTLYLMYGEKIYYFTSIILILLIILIRSQISKLNFIKEKK